MPLDMQAERETQQSVDEGHQPWRLDAAWVACVGIGALSGREDTQGKFLDTCLRSSNVKQNDGKATVIVFLNGFEYRVNLERLVKADGIWTARNIRIEQE